MVTPLDVEVLDSLVLVLDSEDEGLLVGVTDELGVIERLEDDDVGVAVD